MVRESYSGVIEFYSKVVDKKFTIEDYLKPFIFHVKTGHPSLDFRLW